MAPQHRQLVGDVDPVGRGRSKSCTRPVLGDHPQRLALAAPPATRIGGCGRCRAGGEFSGRARRWCTPRTATRRPDHIRWAIRSTSSRCSKRSAGAGRGCRRRSPPRRPIRRRPRSRCGPPDSTSSVVTALRSIPGGGRRRTSPSRRGGCVSSARRGRRSSRSPPASVTPRQPGDGDLEQVVGGPQAVQPGLVTTHGEGGHRRLRSPAGRRASRVGSRAS